MYKTSTLYSAYGVSFAMKYYMHATVHCNDNIAHFHLVKVLHNNSKSSPAQDSDGIELQANPSYVTVGAAHIQ